MIDNIIIKFKSIDDQSISSYSSLLIKADNKKYFLPNTSSWIVHNTKSKILELEYICLIQKKDDDIIHIEYKDIIYEIKCEKKILIKYNDVFKINFYIDLSIYDFNDDPIDKIKSNQILCFSQINQENLPSIQCSIYNEKIIFNKWYNYNNRLLFYSKDMNNKYNATIQIFKDKSIFYINTSHYPLKDNIIFYSIIDNNSTINELNQIDCQKLEFNFNKLNLTEPLLIADSNYFDINNISNNLSITKL